jgi:hypothetical protein
MTLREQLDHRREAAGPSPADAVKILERLQ